MIPNFPSVIDVNNDYTKRAYIRVGIYRESYVGDHLSDAWRMWINLAVTRNIEGTFEEVRKLGENFFIGHLDLVSPSFILNEDNIKLMQKIMMEHVEKLVNPLDLDKFVPLSQFPKRYVIEVTKNELQTES